MVGAHWGTLGYTVATVVFASAGAVTNAMSVGPGTLFALLLPVEFLLLTRVTSVDPHHLPAPPLGTPTCPDGERAGERDRIAAVPRCRPGAQHDHRTHRRRKFDRAQEPGFAAQATGPIDHWHVPAGYLLPVVLLGVALLFDRTQQIMSTGGLAACVGAAVIAMALTLTSTTASGLLVGVGLIAARRVDSVDSSRSAQSPPWYSPPYRGRRWASDHRTFEPARTRARVLRPRVGRLSLRGVAGAVHPCRGRASGARRRAGTSRLDHLGLHRVDVPEPATTGWPAARARVRGAGH